MYFAAALTIGAQLGVCCLPETFGVVSLSCAVAHAVSCALVLLLLPSPV
jgi:hypothetical protein